MIRTPKRTRYVAKTKKKSTAVTRIPTQVRFKKQTFPKQLFNTLRYVDWFTFNFTSGLGTYIFSANSLYDPNTSGTGHQPLGFDQLAAIYNHYTVLKSRIKCQFNTIIPFILSVKLDDDATPAASAPVALEQPYARGGMFYGPGSGIPTIYHSFDAAKVFGPNPMSQEDLQGSSGANPLDGQYFQLQVYEPQLTSGTIQCLVTIDYDVVWTETTTIGTS